MVDCSHRAEMVILEARVRGAEVLGRHLEEAQRENDILRHQLAQYDQLLLRVQNGLETYQTGQAAVPAASRPVVEALLEENQRLKQELLYLRSQVSGSEGGSDSERADLLQVENERLRFEVQDLEQVVRELRASQASSDGSSELRTRLERAERIAKTKGSLCEHLAVKVEELSSEQDTLQQKLAELQLSTVRLSPRVDSKDKELEEERDRLTKDVEKLTRMNASWEEYAKELQAKLHERDAEIAGLREALNRTNSERTKQEDELERLEAQLALLQTNLVKASQQNQALSRNIAEMRIDHNKNIQRLEDQLVGYKLQAEEYERAYQEQKTETSRLERLNTEYQQNIQELRAMQRPETRPKPTEYMSRSSRPPPLRSNELVARGLAGAPAMTDSPAEGTGFRQCSTCQQAFPDGPVFIAHVKSCSASI